VTDLSQYIDHETYGVVPKEALDEAIHALRVLYAAVSGAHDDGVLRQQGADVDLAMAQARKLLVRVGTTENRLPS
jgi:hypothetical protein